MSDAVKVVRELLSGNLDVTSLLNELGDSNYPIFGGALPEYFDPTNNPAIVITVKGGTSDSELPIQDIAVQVVCWAGINQFVLAREVYEAVFACLHGIANLNLGDDGKIIRCIEQAVGHDIVDPNARWVMVMNSFSLMLTAAELSTSAIVSGGVAVDFGGYL